MTNKEFKLNPVLYFIIDWIQSFAVYALAIAAALSTFLVMMVYTDSMYPTLDDDVLLVKVTQGSKLDYGDIVTFFPEGSAEMNLKNGLSAMYQWKMNNKEVYVKRVVGLGGDVLEVKDGHLWRNGVELEEEYTYEDTGGIMEPYTVPEGEIFCMGDNRNYSTDSRYFGSFSENVFIGKVIFTM